MKKTKNQVITEQAAKNRAKAIQRRMKRAKAFKLGNHKQPAIALALWSIVALMV